MNAEPHTTSPHQPDATAYAFAGADHTSEQLAILQDTLDPLTRGVLDRLDLPPAARCLDIGAGGGTITAHLAHRLAPTAGHVTAADLDTTHLHHLHDTDNIDITAHDITAGPPPGRPWQLIHARLVLLHLPVRQRLLRQLVHALAPGGWLVLGEFSDQPLSVRTAATEADTATFHKVLAAVRQVLADHGADLQWAHHLHSHMVELGLGDVHTIEHAETWAGGTRPARLHHINSLQLEPDLRAAGITSAELDHFRALAADPRFCARGWQFVCTRGRKPADS